MAASCGVASAGKGLRYAEYSPPTAKLPDEQRLATVCWAWSNRRGRGLSGPRGASGLVEETDKKTGIGRYRARNFIAVGPGVTAFAFAGRYACQIWKTLGPVITETTKTSAPSFSSYYKGGFEQKMSRCEASLILDVSLSGNKARIRTGHRRIMVLNHPDKGESPYLATKINEVKDLLESRTKH